MSVYLVAGEARPRNGGEAAIVNYYLPEKLSFSAMRSGKPQIETLESAAQVKKKRIVETVRFLH